MRVGGEVAHTLQIEEARTVLVVARRARWAELGNRIVVEGLLMGIDCKTKSAGRGGDGPL